ncbi:putative E3 ubiquitin-protein ligase HIP1 isoform X2 [Cinnamomum micranthum f. kanehirae]|uniref:RING-type E3 ubiquitin transferase n=1 Tax=Cinnamomum micranthum f. kanehirae TaxID=337451 RepID=A0A443NWY1_9MAGN|nr:putative E3 ubiquitin-protein ligase HIP1 isoform X2 [Cinnamomum micranthum f. kanehirae]
MQFPRSTVQSLPETFEFDHASSSNNSGLNQQLFWNSMLNPIDTRNMQEYLPSPSDNTAAYANTVSHAGVFNGWNPGGPSSSSHPPIQASNREAITEQEWMNSIPSYARASMRLEERNFDPTRPPSLESVSIDLNHNQMANRPFIQNSISNGTPQSAHVSAGFVGNVDGVTEAAVSHHPYKPGGSETGQIPSAGGSSSDPCATNPGTAEHPVDVSDGRPGCSEDSRRLSCKRKTMEEASERSFGGSPNYQQAESSTWHTASGRQNTSGNLSISSHVEHLSSVNPQVEPSNPRLDEVRVAPDSYPTLTGDGSVESPLRINPAHQVFAQRRPGNNIRRPHVLPPHPSSSRLIPSNQSPGSRQAAPNAASVQTQSPASHFPGYMRNMHPFSWNGAPNSGAGSSSNSPLTLGERSLGVREEANFRSMPRSISDPLFLPAIELGNVTQDPTNWTVSIPGNPSTPENDASQTGSSSGVHPLPIPTWVPQQHPPHYPRRLVEPARRSLFPSAGSEPGGSSSNYPSSRTAPTSSQEMGHPGAGHQGHQLSNLRSAFLMERLGDGAGVPLPLRALTSASEGRSRLASEIRNVLELMRRGENIRIEDVLMLDQSVLFGVPDLHDRHRDMRLDVDNMSYEELLALEERIGNVSTGLIEETILKCLKQRKYASIAVGADADVDVVPCSICQEEYVEGEDLGTLDCGHDFHTDCIKQWLMVKNICPICKTTALIP